MTDLTPTDDAETAPPTGWQGVTDDALAVWALDRIRDHQAEVDRIRRNANDYLQQIQAQALADEAPHARSIEWLEGELITYFRSLDTDAKTYKLPNGQLSVRAGRPSTKVVEPEKFIMWALDNAPDALDHKPLVSVMAKWDREDGQVICPDGEVVPGVEVVTGPDSYSVKPIKRAD